MQALFHFRNKNHLAFFILSAIIFSVNAYWKFSRLELLIICFLAFFVNTVIAYLVVVLAKKASRLYSRDCIWFNGLIANIYLLIIMLA
jgi:uncharacterized membrane protein